MAAQATLIETVKSEAQVLEFKARSEWKMDSIISMHTVLFHALLSYIILLYPDERRPTTVRSNDTLVDTPFQLISGFFHVNQGVLCC